MPRRRRSGSSSSRKTVKSLIIKILQEAGGEMSKTELIQKVIERAPEELGKEVTERGVKLSLGRLRNQGVIEEDPSTGTVRLVSAEV